MERPEIKDGSDIITIFNASNDKDKEDKQVRLAFYINRQMMPAMPAMGGRIAGNVIAALVNYYTQSGVPWADAQHAVVTSALEVFQARKDAVKGQDWEVFKSDTSPERTLPEDEEDLEALYVERLARVLAARDDESWDSLDDITQKAFIAESCAALDEVFHDDDVL